MLLQAIAALNKALGADPTSLEVLLSLGVSHTNELDAGKPGLLVTVVVTIAEACQRMRSLCASQPHIEVWGLPRERLHGTDQACVLVYMHTYNIIPAVSGISHCAHMHVWPTKLWQQRECTPEESFTVRLVIWLGPRAFIRVMHTSANAHSYFDIQTYCVFVHVCVCACRQGAQLPQPLVGSAPLLQGCSSSGRPSPRQQPDPQPH